MKPAKNHKMKYPLLYISIILLLIPAACGDQSEIDQDKMVDLYVNILIVEETYTNNLDSLTLNTKKVFDSFGVTEEEYKFTMESYKEDKDYWIEFFQKSLVLLDSLKSGDLN